MVYPARPNVAVTLLLLFMVRTQVADDPEHAPDQPVNVELPDAEAVRVTVVPAVKVVPVGELVTVPLPVPALLTLSAYVTGGTTLKLAWMLCPAVTLVKEYDDTAPTDAPSTFTSAMV